MGLPIRYSPSGPVIGGANGQPVQLVENQDTMTPVSIQTTPTVLSGLAIPEQLYATILNPKVDNLYSAYASFTVENTDGSNPVILTTRVEFSYDAALFFLQKSISHTIPAGGFRTILTQQIPILGSALATPMPSGAAQLTARITASADNAGDAVVGPTNNQDTYHLQLLELVTLAYADVVAARFTDPSRQAFKVSRLNAVDAGLREHYLRQVHHNLVNHLNFLSIN